MKLHNNEHHEEDSLRTLKPLELKRQLKFFQLEKIVSSAEKKELEDMSQDEKITEEIRMKIFEVLEKIDEGMITVSKEGEKDNVEATSLISPDMLPIDLENTEAPVEQFSLNNLTNEEAYMLSAVLRNARALLASKDSIKDLAENKILALKNIPEKDLYHTFFVKKSDGKSKREINEPHPDLKEVQDLVMDGILSHAQFDHVYSYQKNKSPSVGFRDVLAYCEGAESVHYLKVDISDFFGSIRSEHLYKRLYFYLRKKYCGEREKPSTKKDPLKLTLPNVELLTRAILKLVMFKERLPQGTATSPMMSNFAGKTIDKAIKGIIEDDVWYGRYSDDFVILRKEKITEDTLSKITQVLGTRGFKVNEKKTKSAEDQEYIKMWGGVIHVQNADVQVGRATAAEYAKHLFQLMTELGERPKNISDLDMDNVLSTNKDLDQRVHELAAQLNYAFELASLSSTSTFATPYAPHYKNRDKTAQIISEKNSHAALQKEQKYRQPLETKNLQFAQPLQKTTTVEVQKKIYFNPKIEQHLRNLVNLEIFEPGAFMHTFSQRKDPYQNDYLEVKFLDTKQGEYALDFFKQVFKNGGLTPRSIEKTINEGEREFDQDQTELLYKIGKLFRTFDKFYHVSLDSINGVLHVQCVHPFKILKEKISITKKQNIQMQIHLPTLPRELAHALGVAEKNCPEVFLLLYKYLNKQFISYRLSNEINTQS